MKENKIASATSRFITLALCLVGVFTLAGSASADLSCLKVRIKNDRVKVLTRVVSEPKCPRGFKEIFDSTQLGLKGDPGTPGVPADVSVRVSRSVAQTIPNGTFVEVRFDTSVWDSAAAFDPNDPAKLTIPEDGKYLVYATLPWAPSTTGIRRAAIHVNGDFSPIAISRNVGAGGAIGTVHSISSHYELNAGDLLTLEVYQSSGVALNVIQPQVTGNKVSGAEFGFAKLP